jgi:hypothetical protein
VQGTSQIVFTSFHPCLSIRHPQQVRESDRHSVTAQGLQVQSSNSIVSISIVSQIGARNICFKNFTSKGESQALFLRGKKKISHTRTYPASPEQLQIKINNPPTWRARKELQAKTGNTVITHSKTQMRSETWKRS